MKNLFKFLGIMTLVVIIGIGLGACNTDPGSSESAIWKEADIVVVGAGLAGSAAAMTAVEKDPNLKVILIEAGVSAGGTMARAAGGMAKVIYDWHDDPTSAKTTWDNTMFPSAASNVYTGIANSGYPNYDKLAIMASFAKELYDIVYPRWGIAPVGQWQQIAGMQSMYGGDYTDGKSGGTGAEGARLFNAAVNKFVNESGGRFEFIIQCKATDLYRPDGVVSGVYVTHGGESNKIIKAKKTIIATGGFTQSPYWLKKTNPDLGNYNIAAMADYNRSMAMKDADGGMLQPVIDAGAAIYEKWNVHLQGAVYDERLADTDIYRPAFIQPIYAVGPQLQMYRQMLINNEGKRFVSENAGVAYGSGPSNRIAPAPHGKSYQIGHYLWEEGKPPYYIIFNNDNPPVDVTTGTWGGMTPPATALNLSDALEAGAALNIDAVVKGTTLAALADKMGLSAAAKANFIDEAASYNQLVDDAVDADDADTTIDPLKKRADLLTKKFRDGIDGPFYAVKLYPESHISMGGPVTNEHGQVMTAEGRPIPNLYGAGEFSNRDYFNWAYQAASSLLLYPAVGRVVAAHAVEAIAANQ
jgi:succinate dehydrogenase/fumarate reductase flavoprotein subunit